MKGKRQRVIKSAIASDAPNKRAGGIIDDNAAVGPRHEYRDGQYREGRKPEQNRQPAQRLWTLTRGSPTHNSPLAPAAGQPASPCRVMTGRQIPSQGHVGEFG